MTAFFVFGTWWAADIVQVIKGYSAEELQC